MTIFRLRDGRQLEIIQQYDALLGGDPYFLVREISEEGQYIVSRQDLEQNRLRTDLSNQEKLDLYMSYFRGRPDVVAQWYQSKKTGKTGYAPVCRIKFNEQAGCQLMQGMKCDACQIRQFAPYTTSLISDHIKGDDRNFYGIYPMLTDDTTYLLVMDFDKADAVESAQAVVATCECKGIDCLIERSRSGKGIHLWFFFSSNLPAILARRFGSAILTATLMLHQGVDFSSYDRMIPMQDTLPTGGFGNLIALPLQFKNVQEGRSTFLTNTFQPIMDLWEHLLVKKRYSEKEILKFTEAIESKAGYELFDKYFQLKVLKREVAYPKAIRCIDAGELVIAKENLSRKEQIQIMYLATFKNPEFVKRQRMRVPIWQDNIPQFITSAREDEQNIYLPRGLTVKLKSVIANIEWQDIKSVGQTILVEFNGTLRPEQEEGFQALSQTDLGILSARTGFGKTVVSAKLIAERKTSTLIIVHLDNLVNQWKSRLDEFLTIETEPFEELTKTGRKRKKEKVGILSGQKNKQSKVVDIVTIGKLAKMANLADFFKDYGMVIVDECHHIAAPSFEAVIRHANVKRLYGLSATLQRKDGLEAIILMRCGQIVFESQRIQSENLLIQQYVYPRYTSIGEISSEFLHDTYTNQLKQLSQSSSRNKQIVQDVLAQVKSGRTILLLSERVAHLKILSEMMREELDEIPLFEMTGQGKKVENREKIVQMSQMKTPFVLLSTSKFAGEGFDLPQLDTLIFALPFSWKGNQQQYLGRLQRNLSEKTELRVYDYVDISVSRFAKMYQKRLATYRKQDYRLAEDEFTSAYQSKVFDSHNYQQPLENDLLNAKNSVKIIMPKLNLQLIRRLEHVKGKVQIITKNPEILRGKVREAQKTLTELLANQSIQVIFNTKIQQSILIIDAEICWYGSIQFWGYKDPAATSIRFVSEKLAKELLDDDALSSHK
ncbi:TOTE conflict system archaeo-eukaryotic primase domain-containing protein [Pseudolactococcus yaeyamensis]